MKRARAAALLTGWMFAAANVAALDAQQLAVHQNAVLSQPGALADFAVDSSIVEVSVEAGQVLLRGRRGGDTVITVILAAGVENIRVHVDPPVLAFDPQRAQAQGATFVEGRYDSGTQRLTAVVSGRSRIGESDVRVYAETLRQLRPLDGEAKTALTAATVEITNGKRSVVLLDQFVRTSPLTLDGVVLRGAHLKEGDLELHAGIASWSPLEGFLVSGGERAATASYSMVAGGLRVTPQLAWFPDSRSSFKGVAAVAVEFGAPEDELRVRGDAALGPSPAAAIDADWRTKQRQVRLRGSIRPDNFAALSASHSAGKYAEGSWTEMVDSTTTVSADGSASDLHLAEKKAQSTSGRVEVRQRLSTQLSGMLSVGGGQARSGDEPSLRRSTIAAGLYWDTRQWGTSVQIRRQSISSASSSGFGARLSARVTVGAFRANAFVDAQQQAPTLDLLLDEKSLVARTLAGLGITAAQPEDILRALRDNAGLLNGMDLAIGPVRLNPLRKYSGLDVSWRGDSAARPEIGVRMLQEDVHGVVGARSSSMASVHANWRIGERTDASVTASRWSLRQQGHAPSISNSIQLMVRTYLDGALITPGWSKSIDGQVFREEPSEASDAPRVPLAGVEVVLDRSRRTHTDSQGRYVFENPGPNLHSIEAVLPPHNEAYFTRPSIVSREAGGNADFGVAFSGVRLSGTVLSDAGLPLAGVMVRAEGASTVTALSDGSGGWRMTLPPGDVRVSLAPETVPPGHDLRSLPTQSRTLISREPVKLNFSVRALRSVEGVIAGPRGKGGTVTVIELARSVTADADGRFIIRQLPAGKFTLVAGDAQSKAPQVVVTLPSAPGVVRNVRLEAQ
jgi:hypothetical protein